MGEARRRKIAREAGRPFAEDAPPAPKPRPWYMEAPAPQGAGTTRPEQRYPSDWAAPTRISPGLVAPPRQNQALAGQLELVNRSKTFPLMISSPTSSPAEAARLARTFDTQDGQRVLIVDEKVALQGTRKRPLTGRELAVIMALISTGGR